MCEIQTKKFACIFRVSGNLRVLGLRKGKYWWTQGVYILKIHCTLYNGLIHVVLQQVG